MAIYIKLPISARFLRVSKRTLIVVYFSIIAALYAIGKSPRPVKQDIEDFEVTDVYLTSAYFYYRSESLGDRSFALLLNSDLEFGENQRSIQIKATNLKETKVINASLENFESHVNLYVRSMVEPVYKLARAYEEMGYVTIDPWVRIELSSIPTYDFNPNINVEFRNQAAAQTDCLLKYKESVEFIVFVDLDDLIFPRVAGTYSDEYRDLFGLNKIDIFTEADNVDPSIRSDDGKSGVGSIQYAKYNVHVEGHCFSNNFSLTQMFSSMHFTHQKETGKIVARPKMINHTWIHWPISMKPGFLTREVPSRTNVITHMKLLEQETDPPNKTVVVPFFDPLYRFGEVFLISPSRIKAIQKDLDRVIQLPIMQKIWKRLPSATFYLELITSCFKKTFYDFYYGGKPERIKCPGPDRCMLPKNPGIPCANARADYYSTTDGTMLNIHYARNHRFKTEDGCIV